MTQLVFSFAAAGLLTAALSSQQSNRPAPQLPADVRANPAQVDLWITRAGEMKQGALQGCSNISCTLDGVTVPRSDLLWIGIGVKANSTPEQTPSDFLMDAVQLTGSPFQNAPLLGVNATNVTTGRGEFSRHSVDWIYVAPVAADRDEPTALYKPTPAPPGAAPAPGAPPSAPPSPPSAPIPSPPMPPGAGAGVPGAAWAGTIIGRLIVEDPGFSYTSHLVTAQLRGRERIHPVIVKGVRIAETVIIESEEVSMTGTFASQEFFAGGSRCSGSGRVAGNLSAGFGWFERKVGNTSLTPYFGYDLPAGGAVYLLGLYPNAGYTVSCSSSDANWTRQEVVIGPRIGRAPNNPVSAGEALSDPDVRYALDGRMSGIYETSSGGYRSAVSWSFCRAGTNCPPPAPLPEVPPRTENEPCRPSAEKALLDVALEQERAMAAAYAKRFTEYEFISNQARQYKNDYDQAARDCQLTTAAKMLTGFLISNPGINVGSLPTAGGAVPANVAKALEQFYNFLGFLENVESGSASWLLPDQNFNDFAKVPNRFGGLADAEMIYDGVSGFLGFLQSQVGDSSPDYLLNSLRACGGFTVGPVMDGAINYLRQLQALVPLMQDLQTRLNDLRAKDNEIFNLWEKYRAAGPDKCVK
jgi:hypothetical protein